MKILIADDSDVTCKILQKIMHEYGEVHCCQNGQQAITVFQENLDANTPFDVVFLDILMPKMDGQHALQLIREEEARRDINGLDGVKIVMVSSCKDAMNILGSFRHQCDAYVRKPYDADQIRQELENIGLIASSQPV